MIIKGGAAGNVAFWSNHLMRDDTNESVRLVELRDVASTDLRGALREMQAIAAQSRSKGNFMYQANINPPADADLSQGQFMEAVDLLERNLGFTGHQRVVVEHVKGGRRHYHVIWNRVDVETLKVAGITGNYRIHEQTARELERRFGLAPVQPRDKSKPRRPELWEHRASERSGIDPDQVTKELTRLWFQTSTGGEFRAALEKAGYLLAKGDRRDFCVVDQAGDVHSLARRLSGVRAEDIRRRLSDIDRDSLPSVAEARQRQRTTFRQKKRKAMGAGMKAAAGQTTSRPYRRQVRQARKEAEATGTKMKAAAGPAASRPNRPRVQRTLKEVSAFRPAARAMMTRNSSANRSPTPRMPYRPQASVPMNDPRSAPIRPGQPGAAAPQPVGRDATATGRAQAAFQFEFDRWQARIDEVMADKSLSPDQRAAAIVSLRFRQQIEASGARKRVMEEEKRNTEAARRHARSLLKIPPTPT